MAQASNFNSIRKEFRYDKGHKGPFLIFLERVDDDRGTFSINRFALAKKLASHECLGSLAKAGYGLRYAGPYRFKIRFKDFSIANKFVEMVNMIGNILVNESWEAYIPEYKICKTYVLQGIDDMDITPEEVKMWLGPYRGEGSFPDIVSVERMKRWIPSDKEGEPGRLGESRNFKIKFRTTEVAEKATFLMATVYLKPFVDNPKQCNYGNENKRVCGRCAEYGHSIKDCKQVKVSCINCVKNNLKDLDHEARNKICPLWTFNKDLKYIMAYQNVDLKEAIDILNKNGGIPPRGRQNYAKTVKNYVDLEKLLNAARERKRLLEERKERRIKQRNERRKRLEDLKADLIRRKEELVALKENNWNSNNTEVSFKRKSQLIEEEKERTEEEIVELKNKMKKYKEAMLSEAEKNKNLEGDGIINDEFQVFINNSNIHDSSYNSITDSVEENDSDFMGWEDDD